VILADLFCRDATRRVEAHFKALASNDDQFNNQVGKSVLTGDMRWLEEGVEWLGSNG
jgi:hypothetical protein